MNIPCYLIPALVGIISGILGYLIGKMNRKTENTTATFEAEWNDCLSNSNKLSAKITALETELAAVKLQKNTSNIQNFAAAAIPFDGALLTTVFGKKIKENDLKIVEGIGPKIEQLYHEAGITTWKQLSETATEKSKAILDGGGERFMVHNPGTWAKQAKLAYEGKWKELKNWQDTLDGGKE